jgi:hypothetical protein
LTIVGLLTVLLLVSSNANIVVTAGILDTPPGYTISNLDPSFSSSSNNEIYDPNFIPGFQSGLTNISVSWSSGNGYGSIVYMVGPWAHEQSGIPHLAVGPQCCNFQEVPHTQQFRRIDWGDYYYVKAGFGPPGVNAENYTAHFGDPPTYVGLRTDWDWTVQLSLNWKSPIVLNPSNSWGSIGIAVTQYVPSLPGKLVYTVVNFWMERNSSSTIGRSADGISRRIFQPNLVAYHPAQVSDDGNETIALRISPYLEDTIRVLGLPIDQNQPPVIAYIYMNVEGYNFGWNTTLWSFKVMTPMSSIASTIPIASALPFVFLGAAVAAFPFLVLRCRVRQRKNVFSCC